MAIRLQSSLLFLSFCSFLSAVTINRYVLFHFFHVMWSRDSVHAFFFLTLKTFTSHVVYVIPVDVELLYLFG